MLQFKDVAPRQSSLKSIGTVSEFVGIGGTFKLTTPENFTGKLVKNREGVERRTRITVALHNAKGQVVNVNCSDKLSSQLREAKKQSVEEFQKLWNTVGSLPILELPQYDKDGNPIMKIDEETGEEVQIIVYSISNTGGVDMSFSEVTVTEEMIKTPVQLSREVDWSQLIAL